MTSLKPIQRTTSLKLSEDQFDKLSALGDALPREKSRLIGEMIDEVWASLPTRIGAMARECARRLLEQKWRGLSGHESLQNRNFRNLEPGHLASLLTFTRQDVEDAFNGRAWRDWQREVAANPRASNPRVYFPQIPSVEEAGDVAAALVNPKTSASKIKNVLIDLTFRCLEMAKSESLKELKRKPELISKSDKAIIEQAKDLQPDQLKAIREFKKLQSEKRIPTEIQALSKQIPAKTNHDKYKQRKR